MKTCKILVIGRTGQVASCLREISDDTWEFIGRPDFDLRDGNQLTNIIKQLKPSLIINCSAYTNVDKAEEEIEEAYELNSEAVKNIAIICKTNNISLIHISTDYVFDGKKIGSYHEDDITNPLSVYGKSKLAGEKYIRRDLQNYIILRTSWVFSHYGTNFVKTMIRLASKGESLKVINDQTGSPTSAMNLAKTIKIFSDKILNGNQNIKYGIYNYCDNPALSWYEFANQIFEILKRYNYPIPTLTPISTSEYKTSAIRPQNSVLDCSLICRNFGIKQYDWASELENTIKKLL